MVTRITQIRLIGIGEAAYNFSLKDQYNATWDLYENTGRRALLSFHPLAWTDFCAAQMKDLEKNHDRLAALDTVAVGISVDSVPCKKAWAESLGLSETRILADFWPHGKVAEMYGLFREANGFSERANVIVDEGQKVAWVKIYPVHSVPDIAEVLGVLERTG